MKTKLSEKDIKILNADLRYCNAFQYFVGIISKFLIGKYLKTDDFEGIVDYVSSHPYHDQLGTITLTVKDKKYEYSIQQIYKIVNG